MNRWLRMLAVTASVLTGILAYNFIASSLKTFKAGDIGLGIATTTHEEYFGDVKVNQTHGEIEEVIKTIAQFKAENKQVVLLMGNSQLHAINYFKPGDHLAVYYLNEMAVQTGDRVRFVQLSSPNINFQEMLIYYLVLKARGALPDWLVIGASYRSFHLSSVRESFLSHLNEIDLRNQSLNNESFMSFASLLPPKQETNTVEGRSMQERVEANLEQSLEDHWEAYRYRGNVRSRLKIIPGIFYQRYFARTTFYDGSDAAEQANMSYFIQTMELAARDSVNILIYQPPHPHSDDPFQYNKSKYDACFERIRMTCMGERRAYFRSFEDAVPLEHWGLNNRGRLDVFHFKDPGHRLVAARIFRSFQELNTKSDGVQ